MTAPSVTLTSPELAERRHPMSTSKVKECAAYFRVLNPVVLSWIASGQLRAIDVSANPGVGRPSWRIPLDAIVEFEARRSAKPAVKPVRKKRKKQAADFVEYF